MIRINKAIVEKSISKEAVNSLGIAESMSEERIGTAFKHFPEETRKVCLASCDIFLHDVLLKRSVLVGNDRFQIDEIAQANANGFLTAHGAGLNIFPIVWRTSDNKNLQIESFESFTPIATAIMLSVQEAYNKTWRAKDIIREATTAKQISDAIKELL